MTVLTVVYGRTPASCVRCGDPAYTTVDGEVQHPCCVLYDVRPGGPACPACASSRGASDREGRRKRRNPAT